MPNPFPPFAALDLVENVMRFESGEMEDDEMIPFFQELVNSGLAWKLQGNYGRTARALIEKGLIHA